MTHTHTLLLETYRRASADQIARGRDWYPAMNRACARIARATGTPHRRAVACAAITSPGVQVSMNLQWTRQICSGGVGGLYPVRMMRACRAILDGRVAPQDGVGGDKVTAFYRAILGDTDAVVLDRWALRACGHNRDSATSAQYARYAAILRDAAASVGETPRDFQAICWIVLRDAHERTNGTKVRLLDIHEIPC